MKIIASAVAFLLFAFPAHAARLDLISRSLSIGQPADVSVGLSAQGTSISTLQFDLVLPSDLALNGARVGHRQTAFVFSAQALFCRARPSVALLHRKIVSC